MRSGWRQLVTKKTQALDLGQVSESVHICRVAKTYVDAKMKIVLAVEESWNQDLKVVVACLEQLGGEKKVGRAPANGLERTISKMLEEEGDEGS